MLRDSSSGSTRPSIVPPVERRTITEEVLVRLRDLLLRGVLKPGTRIDQAELAQNFGVSTVPVREALLRLQSAGLVEVIPHRGVFVSEVSLAELLDIYTTRELLEEQAARVAAQHLTSVDVGELERIARAMQVAATKQQLEDLLALNRQFHFTIYRAARRRHLFQLIEQLWDLSAGYAHLRLHVVPDRASEVLYEIRPIVLACKRKDADALGMMVRYKVHQITLGLLQHISSPDADQLNDLGRGVSAPVARKKSNHMKKSITSKTKTAPSSKSPNKARASSSSKSVARTSNRTRKGRTKGARGT